MNPADVVSSLLILDIASTMTFYGVVFVGLCLIAKQIAKVI